MVRGWIVRKCIFSEIHVGTKGNPNNSSMIPISVFILIPIPENGKYSLARYFWGLSYYFSAIFTTLTEFESSPSRKVCTIFDLFLQFSFYITVLTFHEQKLMYFFKDVIISWSIVFCLLVFYVDIKSCHSTKLRISRKKRLSIHFNEHMPLKFEKVW